MSLNFFLRLPCCLDTAARGPKCCIVLVKFSSMATLTRAYTGPKFIAQRGIVHRENSVTRMNLSHSQNVSR